jgi:hypothetical protein
VKAMATGTSRENCIGIDFSGARKAARKIWVARGTRSSDALLISSIGDLRAHSADPYGHLVDFISSQKQAVIGIDAPFSLPRTVVDRPWEEFVQSFGKRFPTPENFRTWCKKKVQGEVRRDTDLIARTPFCTWNLRLYRQTWAVIAKVIAPLVTRDACRFAPLQTSAARLPLAVEVCPASSLKAQYKTVPSYKGRHSHHRIARIRLLAEEKGIRLSPTLAEIAAGDTEGDALDSILCAAAAANAEMLGFKARRGSNDSIEGRVYFEIGLRPAEKQLR